MLELNSERATLRVVGPPVRLEVAFADPAVPSVLGAKLGARWIRGEVTTLWQGELNDHFVRGGREEQGSHGPLEAVRLRTLSRDGSLELVWTFALARDRPLVLWRGEITLLKGNAVKLLEIDMLRVGAVPPPGPVGWLRAFWPFSDHEGCGRLSFASDAPELAWLTDGWQSWSFSGVVSHERAVTGTRLGPLTRPMYLNQGARRPPGRDWHTSEFFGVLADRAARRGLLVGQLSERQAFGSLEARLKSEAPALRLYANGDGIRLSSGQTFTTDWAAVQPVYLDAPDPIGPYVEAVARENGARPDEAPAVGWSSWYYYYEDVSKSALDTNLNWMRERADSIPLQFAQLDDGHQRIVGDWSQVGEGFNDRSEVAAEIRAAGFAPGLWLAPFAVHPEADLVEQHSDWLLRGQDGRPIRAGYNWGTFFVALDLTHPDVLEHVRRTIATAVDKWGFHYLKLDFLYAGALQGRRHDPGRTRAQALRKALEVIRDAAGEDVHLSGCGCPLGPAVGVFNSMRVGPDIAARWKPAYQGVEFFFQHEPSLPSARNSIQNTLSRAALHRRWWVNDPDCLLLRGRDTHLSRHEVETLLTVAALSGGSLTISDALPTLEEERVEMFARLLPPIGKAARVVDWFDQMRPQRLVLPLEGALGGWWLVAVLNWLDRSAEVEVDPGRLGLDMAHSCVGFDWWESRPVEVPTGTWKLRVPAHGVRLLRVQRKRPGPMWIGDSLHISGGLPVTEWQVEGASLKAALDLKRRGSGSVWLALPPGPSEIRYDGEPVKVEREMGSSHKVLLEDIRRGVLRVDMEGPSG